MTTDHIRLRQQLIQTHKATLTTLGARRITQQAVHAECCQGVCQAATHLPHANDADALRAPGFAGAFREGQQTAENVLDYAARIATGCAGYSDTRRLQTGQIKVIGADGTGSNKAHRCAR